MTNVHKDSHNGLYCRRRKKNVRSKIRVKRRAGRLMERESEGCAHVTRLVDEERIRIY